MKSATPKLRGIGLHTGAPGWVRFVPSGDGGVASRLGATGLSFVSASAGTLTPVHPGLVSDTRRCTALELSGQRLSTVEHLLAAFSGCEITDAIIEFSGPEVPILDGSAREFVAALETAGTRALRGAPVIEPIRVAQVVTVAGDNGERLVAMPSDGFSVTVVLDYPERAAIGAQAARYDRHEADFRSLIAPARTYGFLSEFEQVRRLGLASGASLENCIALQDDGSPDERTPLRFPNELARHKLLDVMGDLMLAGRPILADIVAVRPSHTVNCLLADRLASAADAR